MSGQKKQKGKNMSKTENKHGKCKNCGTAHDKDCDRKDKGKTANCDK